MKHYSEGDKVSWTWGEGTGHGKVLAKFEHTIEKTIKGKKITRKGNKDDPAYYIETDNGSNVLKLESELD